MSGSEQLSGDVHPFEHAGAPTGVSTATEPTAPRVSSVAVEGNDAVCFTAGPEAAVVGVGTIHAYLAARRQRPKVVAGISLGALNAAAMQRAYREAGRSAGKLRDEQEAARWAWFRHYVDTLSSNPWGVLWDALPNQSDFFADMIPIRDTSVPRHLQEEEAAARRKQYQLVKLGRWLAKLPVSVSLVVGLLVNYVRLCERYPRGQKAISVLALVGHVFNLLTRLVLYVCLSSQFFPEHKFRDQVAGEARALRYRCRIPLFGWFNLFSVTFTLALLPTVGLLVYLLDPFGLWNVVRIPLAVALVLDIMLIASTARVRKRIAKLPIVQKASESVFPVITAYAFSVANFVLCCFVLVGLARALYLHAIHEDNSTAWLAAATIAMVIDVLINLLAMHPVVIPETRRWLLDRGFLRELPRPLLGWVPFLFLWIHLLGLIAYLTLGGYMLAQVVMVERDVFHRGAFHQVTAFALGAWRLFSIPAFPWILAILPVIFWHHLKGFASARTGWRKLAAGTLSVAIAAGLVALGIWLCESRLNAFVGLFHGTDRSPQHAHPALWRLFCLTAFTLTLTWLVMFTVLNQPFLRRRLMTWMLKTVGLQTSLIHDLYLRLKLWRLFDANWSENKNKREPSPELLSDDPMPAVIVAASLQTLYEGGQPKLAYQLWAKPGTPLIHALRAALACTPIFSPVRITEDKLHWWLKESLRIDRENREQFEGGIDLVDGSVVRQNPLPALYSFLRDYSGASDMAKYNDASHPAIHVVYGVPIEGQIQPSRNNNGTRDSDAPGFRNTIVDVGLASFRLSQRRDTQVEVAQANVISRLESAIPTPETAPGRLTRAIFADEIAPSRDLTVGDTLSPSRHEILTGVAMGCRRSLETLYRPELAVTKLAHNGSVACTAFLSSIGRVTPASEGEGPGLPEICERCTGQLHVPTTIGKEPSTVSVEATLGDSITLSTKHPQLTGERPRIVFVASGGVFRGAFHIGMLAALHSAHIKPDLVVGASVGTLMGGALAALFVHDGDVLGRLVDASLRVDDTVALTATLKRAVRELGIRGRAIHLSPRQVRRLLQRGARSDASFATTGAPAALIDALSDLLMIPHKETGAIAAAFIAGRVTGALKGLVEQLRKETIPRLNIERALIGTSLLEDLVFQLLTDGTSEYRLQRQPFQRGDIAFYGTTTDLVTQRSVVLGGYGLHPGAPYDFVEASLASSAFPAVFAPRPECTVFPGTGRADVFLADGGMFDNLPFQPAIEILSHAQRGYRVTGGRNRTSQELLRQRLARPDLVIAGALDFVAEFDAAAHSSFGSLAAIQNRASSLQQNSKIRAFELASQRIYSQLRRLDAQRSLPQGSPEARLVDGMVNAAVLPVFPTSADHLNGTFAFCRSTGLNPNRVRTSIADGCFQTLLALASEQRHATDADLDRDPALLTAKSIKVLVEDNRVPVVAHELDFSVARDKCPYFTKRGERFTCPFARSSATDDPHAKQMTRIFRACKQDPAHHSHATPRMRPRTSSGASSTRPAAGDTVVTDKEADMWFWRRRSKRADRLQSEVLAEIERNRVAFVDMVLRSAMAPSSAAPQAPQSGSPGQTPASSGQPALAAPPHDVQRIQARFAELSQMAKQVSNAEELQQLLDEAEALAALRAYICPAKEISTETKSCLLTLADWGVPGPVVDALKEAAEPALKGSDPDQARGALHVVYEEYDAWASYLDTYNRNTGWWATALVCAIGLSTAFTLVFMLGWSRGLMGVFLAAVTGAMASVIARLPGLTRYGEWVVNLRAFQARVATGIVGSLVGIGLLSSGLISVTLPQPWEKTEYLFGACLRPNANVPPPSTLQGTSQPPQGEKSSLAPPAAVSQSSPVMSALASPQTTASAESVPKTCTPGAGLFLIAVTMLLGFSERILTTLESKVVPAASAGQEQRGK